MSERTREQIEAALAAPFDESEVKFKPGVISGNRALALHYVDVRVVQDRLDQVLGVTGWQDDYEMLEGGSVLCRLKCRIGGEWLTKVDVGGESEQPDGGDRKKAAVSDALKRAAVKFGVGRYLYRLPSQWVDYDPQKKQMQRPQMPPAGTPPPKAPAAKPANGQAAPAKAAASLPKDGAELRRRLLDYEGRLAKQGLCQPGDLVKYVVAAGIAAGETADLTRWGKEGILLAVRQTQQFEADARRDPAELVTLPDLQRLVEAARARLGWEQEAVLHACGTKFGVQQLQDLTVTQWREAMQLVARQKVEGAPA